MGPLLFSGLAELTFVWERKGRPCPPGVHTHPGERTWRKTACPSSPRHPDHAISQDSASPSQNTQETFKPQTLFLVVLEYILPKIMVDLAYADVFCRNSTEHRTQAGREDA